MPTENEEEMQVDVSIEDGQIGVETVVADAGEIQVDKNIKDGIMGADTGDAGDLVVVDAGGIGGIIATDIGKIEVDRNI